MRERIALGLAVATALAAGAPAAAQQDFSRVEVKAAQVSGNVYMLTGAGGNIGAVVGAEGIVIVDDQYAPLAERIREALRGVTDKPVRFVINTHYHEDHAGGNAPFAAGGATIVAQDNVRKRLAAGGTMRLPDGAARQLTPATGGALPIVTFGHDLTLHLNGEEIRALHVPHGHTDGDAIVYFPRANVVHMGDLFVTYGFPFIDLSAGGSSAGIASGLEAAIGRLPADVKVIPGHGPVSTLDDVRRYITMLKETRAAVAAAVKAGKTLEQLRNDKVLARWDSFGKGFVNTDAFTATLYNEVTGRSGGAVVRHN